MISSAREPAVLAAEVGTMEGRYRIERLPNGYVRVDDRASGLVGLFLPDGTPRSGDLTRSVNVAAISAAVHEVAAR